MNEIRHATVTLEQLAAEAIATAKQGECMAYALAHNELALDFERLRNALELLSQAPPPKKPDAPRLTRKVREFGAVQWRELANTGRTLTIIETAIAYAQFFDKSPFYVEVCDLAEPEIIHKFEVTSRKVYTVTNPRQEAAEWDNSKN